MSEIWDLVQYVEAHPDDYDQRWRLAKKLYSAEEYRLALEHLQVLKNNWSKRTNVLRYLAATYYRLKRYDEAAVELRNALREWPKDVPLYEQLAKVLDTAGRYQEAADMWGKVRDLEPHHRMAAKEHERLEAMLAKPSPRAHAGIPAMDEDVLEGLTGRCPQCGAENGEEFDRCWKCHAPLGVASAFEEEAAVPVRKPRGPVKLGPVLGGILPAVVTALFLALGAFLTWRQAAAADLSAESAAVVLPSVNDLLRGELLLTRVFLGGALLLAWPAALMIATQIAGQFTMKQCILFGLLFASLAYALLWVSLPFAPFAVLVALAPAFVLLLLLLNAPFTEALTAWAIQAAIVIASVAVVVGSIEGFAFLKEYPAILRFAATRDGEARFHMGKEFVVPTNSVIRWSSSGSTWLDARACQTSFEVSPDEVSAAMAIEVKDLSGTYIYKTLEVRPTRFDFRPQVDHLYDLLILGSEGHTVKLTVHGLLRPKIGL